MTKTQTTPTCQPVNRGFKPLPCIRCGEENMVRLFLDDFAYENAFSCSECEAEWGIEEVRALLGKWGALLAWLDTAPVLPTE